MTNGYGGALQSTLLVSYPETKLYKMAVENSWLRFPLGEWGLWGISEPIFRNEKVSPEVIKKLCDETYKLFWSPKCVMRKMVSINSMGDLRNNLHDARRVIGYIWGLVNICGKTRQPWNR